MFDVYITAILVKRERERERERKKNIREKYAFDRIAERFTIERGRYPICLSRGEKSLEAIR